MGLERQIAEEVTSDSKQPQSDPQLELPGILAQRIKVVGGRRVVGDLDAPSALEVGADAAQIVDLEVAIEGLEHGAVDQALDQVLLLSLIHI